MVGWARRNRELRERRARAAAAEQACIASGCKCYWHDRDKSKSHVSRREVMTAAALTVLLIAMVIIALIHK